MVEDGSSSTSFVQRLTAYGPLVVTAAVLVVQTVYPDFLKSLPLEATTAVLAGGIIFLAWHVEGTLSRARGSVARLESKIAALETAQSNFLQATSSLSQARLGKAFAEVAANTPRIGHLRVFAISSQQILSFVKFHDITIERCHLLVRAFEDEDLRHADFFNQIKLVVADWKRLRDIGRIGELVIRHYDFFPTEYECIFDRESLILGLYDSDPSDYSEVSVRDPVLIRGSSDGGRLVISEFIARYDNLFSLCETHHGTANASSATGDA